MSKLFSGDLFLLHNPKCSKSRATKALLEERGAEFQVRLYLDDPLDREELEQLTKALGRAPGQWVRKGEGAYKEAGLGPASDDAAIRLAMSRHPILIERPILVAGERAAVGRPPEDVLVLIDK